MNREYLKCCECFCYKKGDDLSCIHYSGKSKGKIHPGWRKCIEGNIVHAGIRACHRFRTAAKIKQAQRTKFTTISTKTMKTSKRTRFSSNKKLKPMI